MDGPTEEELARISARFAENEMRLEPVEGSGDASKKGPDLRIVGSEDDDRKQLPVIDWDGLEGQEPPRRMFAWDQWLPAAKPALLNGFGAVGKTLIAQQLATAYSLGRPLFGSATEGRPAILLAAEDDHDEVWRRQVDICRRMGVKLKDLSNLHIVPDFGDGDMTLARISDNGEITLTPRYHQLCRLIETTKAGLVVLDNSSILFAVNEIVRVPVTRLIGILRQIAYRHNTTPLLLCHNNRGGDFSGSSAWENAVRSRLALTKSDDGQTVKLSRPKANYAGNGEVTLRWENGSFRCEEHMTAEECMVAEAATRQHAEVFLIALDKLIKRCVTTSTSRKAGNYAPKVILDEKMGGGLSKKHLEEAMNLLLDEQRILPNADLPWKKTDRHPACGINRA